MTEPLKKRKKKSITNYFCEWQGCTSTVFDDLSAYLQHVKRHSSKTTEGFDKSAPVSVDCGWIGCSEKNFSSRSMYQLHVSFHAFHSKLMARGDEALIQLKQNVKVSTVPLACQRDPSDRCVIPDFQDEFMCEWHDCFTSFNDAEAFYRHVDTHAMDIAIPSLSKEELKTTRFAICQWTTANEQQISSETEPCNLAFLSKSYLKNHLRSHSQEKSVACSTCGAMFCDSTKFHDHILRQVAPSESDLNFKCNYCAEKFLTERMLNDHLKKHTSSIICEECGKVSNSQSEHSKHYKFKHSDDKPHDCKFCESRFKSRADLRRHIYVHNDQSSFKCTVDGCNFESRSQQSLIRHQKVVHQNQKLNVFECHKCKLRFTRGYTLTKHLVNEHSMQKPGSASRFKYIPDPVTGIYHLSPFFITSS